MEKKKSKYLHWFYTDLKVKVLFRKVPHFLGLFGDFFLSDLYRPKVKVLFGMKKKKGKGKLMNWILLDTTCDVIDVEGG